MHVCEAGEEPASEEPLSGTKPPRSSVERGTAGLPEPLLRKFAPVRTRRVEGDLAAKAFYTHGIAMVAAGNASVIGRRSFLGKNGRAGKKGDAGARRNKRGPRGV